MDPSTFTERVADPKIGDIVAFTFLGKWVIGTIINSTEESWRVRAETDYVVGTGCEVWKEPELLTQIRLVL